MRGIEVIFLEDAKVAAQLNQIKNIPESQRTVAEQQFFDEQTTGGYYKGFEVPVTPKQAKQQAIESMGAVPPAERKKRQIAAPSERAKKIAGKMKGVEARKWGTVPETDQLFTEADAKEFEKAIFSNNKLGLLIL